MERAAAPGTSSPDVPSIAPPCTDSGSVDVAGCAVRYWAWGSTSDRALVLIHGAGAHSGWWHPVIRFLPRHRIVAFDLSGHGRSGRREEYSAATWAAEVAAVVRRTTPGRAVLVGHSMGGLTATVTAAAHPSQASALIVIDSVIRCPGDDADAPRGARARPQRTYATREAVLQAFRLIPPQPVADAALLRYIAEQSVVHEAGRWDWRADWRIYGRFTDRLVYEHVRHVRCPVGVIYGESSALDVAQTPRTFNAVLRREVPTSIIPRAHHHVMLEAPEPLAAAVAGLADRLERGGNG